MMTSRGREKKVLLVEACQEPAIPDEELVLRSHLLGGLSIRNVIERRKKSDAKSVKAGVSTTSLYGIPMGLAFIAAGVDREKFDIQHIPLIIDAYRFRLDRGSFVDAVQTMQPHLVGVTLNHTADRRAALGMCRDIKELSKDILTVLGGVEATFSAREIIEQPCVDYIVEGEGDVRFGRLLEEIFSSRPDFSSIRGLHYRSGGRTAYTGEVLDHVDLSGLSPRYDCFDPGAYMDAGILAHVQTSRGCPYACSFCCHTAFWGKRMRYRSPEAVVSEIADLAEMGAEIVYFCDSTFTMNKEHVVSILKRIEHARFDRPVLVFETRADRVDREMCRLFREAGVGIVALGVESGDEELLRPFVGKGKRGYAKEVLEVHRWLKEEGIEVYASFIVGLPGESDRTMESTKELVTELHEEGLFWADAKLAMAFPGSELAMNPDKYGVKLAEEPAYLFYDRPGFVRRAGPSEEQILKMHRELVSINMSYVEKKDYIVPRLYALGDEVARIRRSAADKNSSGWYI